MPASGEKNHGHEHSHGEPSRGHDHSHASGGGGGGGGHDHGHGSGGDGHGHGHGGGGASKESESVALRAAMIHVIGDIIQSVGVCIAAALIWAFSDRWLDPQGVSYWYRADPVRAAHPRRCAHHRVIVAARHHPCPRHGRQVCTFLFSILVMWTSWGTMRDATCAAARPPRPHTGAHTAAHRPAPRRAAGTS
jgi:hypothetical protein